MNRAYAATSFGQVHYRYAGTPGAPVLVLLHQTPSSSAMFEPLMQELASDFRIVAPDTPGMGLSDAAAADFTIANAARGIIEFLDEVGVDHCHFFGHHTGAAIAVQIAADKGSLVDSLALSGPTLLDDELRDRLRSASKTIEISDDGSHVLAMWQRIRGKDADAPLDIALRETLGGLELGDTYGAAYEAVMQQDFESQLAALDKPVLVFAGTADPLFGKLQDCYELLRNGRMATIEGAKSFVCETHCDQVAALLRGFLGGRES